MSKKRIEIEEGREFVIDGSVFVWNYSNPERQGGVVIKKIGPAEPAVFTVSAPTSK